MKIKFLVMDVDGTLTDGMIYMGESGELFKAFNIKDGCGIKDIIPQYGIIPIIITARESKMLSLRCQELGIEELYQGKRNKLACLNEVICKYAEKDKESYTLENVAYIGDDILDLQCMEPIKLQNGLTGCPADAVDKIKEKSDYICFYNGGKGAVREFIEYIIEK